MSEYGSFTIRQSPPLPSYKHVQEKKAARKKLLEQVEQRRRDNFRRLMQKRRLQSKR